MKSIIIHATSISDLTKKIEEKTEDFTPTLAIVYNSPAYDIRKLVTELNCFPFLVFGSTTVGEIYADDEKGANETNNSIVCMLIDINLNAISLKLFQANGDKCYESGQEVASWSKEQFPNSTLTPAIVTVTSGLTFDTEAYSQGISAEKIEYVFGGIAGDDLLLKETFVYSKDNFSNHGMIVLAIDRDKVDVLGARAFGWGGIGRERIVTKSTKNIVYEIDGRPAIEFYQKYLNAMSTDMPQIGIEYPLEVKMRDGHVAYRAALAIDEEAGALIFGGHIEENSKIKLATVKGKEIINHVTRSITEVLEENPNFTPEIGLLFPCCSRKYVLADYAIQEIETIFDKAKVPLVGFFAYGEIGVFPGGYGFQNETFVTAFLSEKE